MKRTKEEQWTTTHQYTANHGYLERRRCYTEQYRLQQEGDAPATRQYHPGRTIAVHSLRPTVDGARQPARLPREVEAHVHVQQMLERLARKLAHRALPDVREHGVQQLAKDVRADARRAIWVTKSVIGGVLAAVRDDGLTADYEGARDRPDGRLHG